MHRRERRRLRVVDEGVRRAARRRPGVGRARGGFRRAGPRRPRGARGAGADGAPRHPFRGAGGLPRRLPPRARPGRAHPAARGARSIPELQLVDIAEAESAADRPGSTTWSSRRRPSELGAAQGREHPGAGPDVVVTANPGCLLQIGKHLDAESTPVRCCTRCSFSTPRSMGYRSPAAESTGLDERPSRAHLPDERAAGTARAARVPPAGPDERHSRADLPSERAARTSARPAAHPCAPMPAPAPPLTGGGRAALPSLTYRDERAAGTAHAAGGHPGGGGTSGTAERTYRARVPVRTCIGRWGLPRGFGVLSGFLQIVCPWASTGPPSSSSS